MIIYLVMSLSDGYLGDDSYKTLSALRTVNGSVKTRYVSRNVFKKSMLKNRRSIKRSMSFSSVACRIFN